MKTILLAILFIWLSASAAFAQKACDQFRSNTTTGTTTATEKIAGIPDKRIYLCGYVFIRNSSGQDLEFELTSGTGVNCSQNSTPLLTPITMPPNQILVNRISVAAGEYTPPGHSVCLRTFGNGSVTGIFYWAQF
jgi:hypothetical protein